MVVVVNVLHHIVYRVLKALDVGVVVADLVAVRLDDVLHLGLAVAEVVHYLAEAGVSAIVTLKGSVHLIGLLLEFADLLFFWLDLTLKLFDLVVKHKLKLLQLLRLLLESVDLILLLSDGVVFLDDLERLLSDLLPQLLDVLLLLLELSLFVLLLASELVDLELSVS